MVLLVSCLAWLRMKRRQAERRARMFDSFASWQPRPSARTTSQGVAREAVTHEAVRIS